MNDTLKNGIGGAIIGATIMFGGMEVSVNDTDSVTGEKYSEVVNNPEKDVYYIFNVTDVTTQHWQNAHQKPETARYSIDGSKVILKFDIYEVPRNEQYPEPLTNEEILEVIQGEEWTLGDGEIVRGEVDKIFVEDTIISE